MNKRILVVDDEATIRMSLVEAFTAEGYEVEDAESGEEALARCHAVDFDLLITYLKMPGISGLEVLKKARKQEYDFPAAVRQMRRGDPAGLCGPASRDRRAGGPRAGE